MRYLLHTTRPLLSIPHWRGRLLLWAGAAAVGCAAVGFARLADLAQATFRQILAHGRFWPWLLISPPLYRALAERYAA